MHADCEAISLGISSQCKLIFTSSSFEREGSLSEIALDEQVLSAWIRLNSVLKDSRMTKDLTYNEAIVMNLVYRRYVQDPHALVSVKAITHETNMLKSQVNRTITALCDQGFLTKQRDSEDGRNLFVAPVAEKLPEFLAVHAHSLAMVQAVIEAIGEEDARTFVSISERVAQAEQQIKASREACV